MNQNWLNRPELKNLNPQKKQFLTELIQEAGNTSEKNLPMLYMKVLGQMKSLGLDFTKEESALIMEILESQMSINERARFQAMKKMLASAKK